jgi:hypothetical protein
MPKDVSRRDLSFVRKELYRHVPQGRKAQNTDPTGMAHLSNSNDQVIDEQVLKYLIYPVFIDF